MSQFMLKSQGLSWAAAALFLAVPQVRSNPPVDPVPFGHSTLRDEAAQRRAPARWATYTCSTEI
jgi:hypothetical protein